MYNILLIEDDKDIREMVEEYFREESLGKYNIHLASDGQSGVEMLYENSYDLLLLDVMLPNIDGFEICKEIRKSRDIPIMFITARTRQSDILHGYSLGCDDYIIKPFALPVLYEKVKALIKRSRGLVRSPILSSGTITLNPNNGTVFSDGEEIKLTATEYGILKLLLENKGIVVSREKIIRTLWDYEDTDIRILDTHIKNLRKALKSNSKLLKTVVRRGFKLENKDEKEQ